MSTQPQPRPAPIVRTTKLTHAQKSALIQIGQRMSNMLYNMAQNFDVPKEWRDAGKDLQLQWDKARHP